MTARLASTPSRRAALGAGLATLLPAPPPARFLAAVAAVAIDTPGATAFGASPIAASAAPGVAARATPDPIFAALAAAAEATRRHRAVSTMLAADDSPEAEALFAVEEARITRAAATLAETLPTTLPGLAALARYHVADVGPSNPSTDGLAHLARALAGVEAPALLPPPPRVEADPILPAIENLRAASGDLTAALAGLDEADPVQLRRADEAADRSSDARNALARVQPTTWAGFRALVRFHAEDTAEMEPDTFAALALQDIATALDAMPPAPS